MIRLRAAELNDLELMYEIENDETLWTYGGQGQPVSRYALKRFIEESACDIVQDRQMRLTIELDGSPIGFLDLTDYNPMHQRAEVGIVIVEKERGRGYAKAALERLVEMLRGYVPVRMLYALVTKDNEASHRLFRSAGYEHTATLRGWFQQGGKVHDAEVWQMVIG